MLLKDKSKKIFLVIFGVLLAGFLFHYWLDGQAVYGDGIYYWMLTRSIGIDHDAKLNNEVAHNYDWAGNNTREKQPPVPKDTKQLQLLAFHLPVGPGLFFLPWFFLGDGVAHSIAFFNPNVLTNGYSDTYQITVGIGVLVYFMIGLISVFRLLKKFYPPHISWMAILFVLFSSDLFYYSSLDILNSHAISFMLSSLVIYLLYQFYRIPSSRLAFVIGLLYGSQVITRTQDALFIVCIVTVFSFTLIKNKFVRSIKGVTFAVLFILGTTITMSPQLAVWDIIYGGIFNVPYAGANHAFDFLHPHLIGLLINPHTGILFFSPVLLFCIYGMYYLIKTKAGNMLGVAGLLTIIVEYYLIASWGAWYQAESYGVRMLISCMPFFMLGLGALIKKFEQYKKTILSLCTALIIVNLAGILIFQLVLKNPTIDMGHTTKQVHLQKLYHLFHL
jgi:hypothetical protein